MNSSNSFLARIRVVLSPRKPKSPLSPPPQKALPDPSPPGLEFDRVFRQFDEDGDGGISAAELCKCLRIAGAELSHAEAESVVESLVGDGDGKLGYGDFIKLLDVEEEEHRGRALREAFAAYEMEGRGCITARSLRRRLLRLGEEKTVEDCRDMIKKFDVNGDGVISFDEFKLMMM